MKCPPLKCLLPFRVQIQFSATPLHMESLWQDPFRGSAPPPQFFNPPEWAMHPQPPLCLQGQQPGWPSESPGGSLGWHGLFPASCDEKNLQHKKNEEPSKIQPDAEKLPVAFLREMNVPQSPAEAPRRGCQGRGRLARRRGCQEAACRIREQLLPRAFHLPPNSRRGAWHYI